MNTADDPPNHAGLWAGVAALFVGAVALLARSRSAHASAPVRPPAPVPMSPEAPKPLGRAPVQSTQQPVPLPVVVVPAPIPTAKPARFVMPFTASTWEPIVGVLAPQAIIPIPFVMTWIAKESGGNPCAVGELAAVGPDGSPKEIGLFQIYNPDDFAHLGARASDFVAYCVRPTPGQPNPQTLARPMTNEEMIAAVAIGIGEIKAKRVYAEHYLGMTGTKWNAGGPMAPDYWSTVKLAHALPVILNTGLAQVTKQLGRAPATWHEFRATYETINPRAKNPSDGYYRALQNAEETGFSVPPQNVPKVV